VPFSKFLLYLVVALTCFPGVGAFAAQQSNHPKACFTTNATVPDGLYANDDTDVNAGQDYARAIYLLLEQENFAQLDCVADAARKNKDRFSSGYWKLSAIYEGVANTIEHGTNEDWNARLLHIQHWVASNPKSITAQIAEAQLHAYLAWVARGNGSSDTVSDSGWKLFNERMAEAKRLLETSPELKQCPDWYWVMQQVALAQGWPVAQQRALLEQAVALEPTFYPYYRTFSYAISTNWYGQDGDSEKFALEMADRLKGDDGDIIAFEVAARLAPCCKTDDVVKRISFERIRRGYTALQKRYGKSFTNMNVMAFIAVRSDDAIYANSLLQDIGEQWDKEIWGARDSFEEQQRMTAQIVPMRQMQLSRHKAVDDNLKTALCVRFKVALESRLHSSVQNCVDTAADPGRKFQILILLNKEGKLERAYPEPFSMVAQCLMAKLADYYGPHAQVLLVPPQDTYWMEVVDPAIMANKN
jgi:hypothetical protein